jgi:hypothetical protein
MELCQGKWGDLAAKQQKTKGFGVENDKFIQKHKTENRKKKGRKPKIDLGDDEEGKKAMRAEKNRLFARQSRERKKRYIEELKAELERTKNELSFYKAKFSKYEIIEQQRNSNLCEIYNWIGYIHREAQNVAESEKNNTLFVKLMSKAIEEGIKQRCKAVENITKIMLELAMPSTIRLYRVPSPGKELCTPIDLMKTLDHNISLDEANKVCEYVKRIFPEKSKYVKLAAMMEASKDKIKAWMKELLICQKKLQIELKKVYLYFLKDVARGMQVDAIEPLAGVVNYLVKKPEYSDYAVYQIKDKDFVVDDCCITQEASVIEPSHNPN